MPATNKVLISAKSAEAAQTSQYTSPPAGLGTLLDKFTATNTSGTTAAITVHLVSDGTASDDDMIVKAKSLAAGESYTFPELVGAFIAPGTVISTLASAAASITIRASGRELT